jgi:hypothetical protein
MLIIPPRTLRSSNWAVQRWLEAATALKNAVRSSRVRYVICPLLSSSLYKYR